MQLRRSVVPFLAIAALAVGGSRAFDHRSASRRDDRPNVLVVTFDTLRADHVSAFGYARPTTPTLEALARQGFRFERAYSPMPATGPAHTSLMTGRSPRAHGVVRNGMRLDDSTGTLAERLREAGYNTAAVVSGYPLASQFGLAQGFASYDDAFPDETASIPVAEWEGRPLDGAYDRRADATADRAVARLDDLADEVSPFFVFVHFFDPHSPYAPPGRYASAFGQGRGSVVDRYDGEIAFADAQFGRLLDALRRHRALENTLVVVTSDHGEGLGDHGQDEHGPVVYDEAVRVPLLFAWFGRVSQGASSSVVSLTDIAPTVLELIGLQPGPAGGAEAGTSLAPVLRRTGSLGLRHVVLEAEHAGRRTQRAVTDGRFKLVQGTMSGPRRTLFDLLADPRELRSILTAQASVAAQLAADLPAAPGIAEVRELEARDVEALQALGYLD